ncbi:hypothetical protein [Nocardia sp. NBC_00416]|uniref:hypothetical protein n=1 Tax=Nocardia sp. NBC_00416 TaxID=2975991 RepID=UPI002E20FA03
MIDPLAKPARRASYFHRVLVIAMAGALLGLVSTPFGVAQPSSVPASSVAGPKHLLGFDPAAPLPAQNTAPTFTFPSADDVLRLPAPPDRRQSPAEFRAFQRYLDSLDKPQAYTAGSPAHFYARWKAYQAEGGKSSFEKYRARYVNITNNRHAGWAFEPFLRGRESLFSGSHWQFGQPVPGSGADEKPDMYADTEVDAFELKFTNNLRVGQLNGFVTIAQAKGKVFQYLFAKPPSKKALDLIDKVNRALPENSGLAPGRPLNRVVVVARYYPATSVPIPVPEDAHAPPRPEWGPPPSGGATASPAGAPAGVGVPSATAPLVMPGQYGMPGGLGAAVTNSPGSPAEAVENDELDRRISDEYAAEPGRAAAPDAAVADDLGGVDFATLELRYVSDTYHNGSSAQYAFQADTLPTADQQSFGGRRAAQLASDSFFVWLALPPSAFTVNLNPDEPDRIIDSEFGRTDAGRVLLEADLSMKKLVARFIHPDTPGGQNYWTALRGDTKCVTMRQWIVPDTATVRDAGNELYILDAPLEVKMESDVIATEGVGGIGGCPGQDEATTRHNESVYRTMVLPQVQDAINHSPEYADLRRVYASRVAAEWFRDRSETKETAYSDLIDSGDIGPWRSREPWTPREVFDRYVESYKNGEFNITHTTTSGDILYTTTFVYGGVDFTRIDRHGIGTDEFAREHPSMAPSAGNARYGPVGGDSEVWLGGLTTSQPPTAAFSRPTSATANPWFYPVTLLPVAVWLAAGALLVWRRRARNSLRKPNL